MSVASWNPTKLHFEFPVADREERFKELILYVSHECLDDPTFSRTKLLKILFFSDFEAFGRSGKPITGMPYKKLPYGPAPAMFPRLQAEMLRDNLIRIVARRVYEHERQRVLPLKDADVEHFSAREISIVDSWIRFFWNKTTKEVSNYSHGKAWKLANEGDPIPYEAVFISNEPVTDEDAERAKNLASKYGWNAQACSCMADQRQYRTLIETPEYTAQRDAIIAKQSEEVIAPPINGLLWGIATNPDRYDRVTAKIYRALSRSLGLTVPVLRIYFGIEDKGTDNEHVLLMWIEEVEEMLGSL